MLHAKYALHGTFVVVCIYLIATIMVPSAGSVAQEVQEKRVVTSAEPQAYSKTIRPFLEEHCVDCHGKTSPQAGLRLDTLDAEFTAPDKTHIWTKVLEKLETGSMPPKKQPRPPQAERNQVVAWIDDQLLAADRRAQGAAGSVGLRRLTRLQYQNTIHDLLAIDLELKDLLPEDNRAFGFDNIGAALNLSSVHLQAYLEASRVALNKAVVHRAKPERVKQRFDGPRAVGRPYQRASGQVLDLEDATVVFGRLGFAAGSFQAPADGSYRFRASVSGYQTQGQPLEIAAQVRLVDLIGQPTYFQAPPDTPKVIEFVWHLKEKQSVSFSPHKLPGFPNIPNKDPKAYRGPGLAVQWVEVDGPLIDAWPPPSHTHLFGDLPLHPAPAGGPGLLTVVSNQPRADAARLLRGFMRRAFRRPIADKEEQPFVDLVLQQLEAKRTFEEAMGAGYQAILCAPDLLFCQDKRGEKDDFALAARLSYFLWNTMPDEELSNLAERGTLSQPATLRAQVERLLNHRSAQGFIQNFLAQWLELRLIDFTTPDRKLYPEFDVALKLDMVQETERFFEEVLKQDLSVANFVDSDFSFLNERLAAHYGIAGVKGRDFRRVPLPPGSHRGGVLTHASVLKVTANGTQTQPVQRGVWVLKNILGKPPQPPPPGVPGLEADTRGARTIRERLERHRQDTSCATCHVKIDPLGFAMENFDVIGAWREKERVLSGPKSELTLNGPAVQTDSGLELPNGQRVTNIDDLKKHLLADKDQLARSLTEKLLIYGTGKGLRYSDRAVVREIVGRLRARNYGLRSLIHEIVQSRTFLNQ